MKPTLQQQQELKQLQRLTPMQVQFVRMLEMTGPELEGEVNRALDEMPALEIAENQGVTPDNDGFNETAEQVQLADYGNDDDIPSYMLDARNRSVNDTYYTPVAVNDELTLAEDLSRQLSELPLSPRQLTIANYIIGNLDSNGYLKRTPEAIADDITFTESVETEAAEVSEVIDIIRTLDPAGVGAVDLRDCLLLQLNRRQPTVEVITAREIITHYFDLFSKKHFDRLADLLGIDTERLTAAVDIISRLNPKPGNQLNDSAIEHSGRQIVPELQVEIDSDNNLTVSLLNNIPDLALSRSFSLDTPMSATLTPRQRTDAATFIRTRRDEAQAFIKTLQMRQSTLLNVMTAIASLQRDFFLTGDETRLHPMILKDVAAVTGYDLSVISRATASKYVLAPSGIYPLKFFFNERPKADDDVTSHQIIDAIKTIISQEDKRSPLPDETIAAMLSEKGFNIARRTVAKYRERLGLPVARLRKTI
ncbi:MAG: RNA polymerase sigma-54 factor [Bacteroidales bacterium 52_46]|nr:MAG: RNA polymerase sigma-54 factor [Bacteroidales bacterium 52_46]